MEGCIEWCSPYNAAFPIDSEGTIIMSVANKSAIEHYSPKKTAITRLTISHGTYGSTAGVDKKC